MISDNIIIAFETIHYLKNLRNGKNAQMVVKLDMSKVYNRVRSEERRVGKECAM